MSNVGVSVTLSLDELIKVEKLADEVGISRSKMVSRLIRIGLLQMKAAEKEEKEKKGDK